MTKISIITPVYNSEKYLEQCIKSVLNQSFEDFEFILINDGSTDLSLEILKKFEAQDSRIKIFNSENKGQGAQRNYALSLSEGEYILFLDSDDWLNIGALEKIYDKFKKDNPDIIFFNAYRYIEKTKQQKEYLFNDCFYSRFKEEVFDKNNADDILFNINALAFKAYKKDFLIKNNVKFSSLRFIEDNPFFIKAMLYAKKYSCINDFLVYYRIDNTSTSSKAHLYTETIKETFFNVEKIFLEYYENNKNEKLLNSFLNNRITQLRYYFENLNKNKSKYYKMAKKIFLHIDKKYGRNFLYLSPNKLFFENVLKYNYFQYKIRYYLSFIKAHLGSYLDIV